MKKEMVLEKKTSVKVLTKIGVLSAIAGLLMLIEFPLWFAPPFYKLDLSEVAILLGGFALGPIVGATIEFIKILLNFVMNGTTTGGVGELANFLIGCGMVMPAAYIYKINKTMKSAILGLAVGTIVMSLVGGVLNAYVLIPTYAKVFGMPLDKIIAMGTVLNSSITNLSTFVLYAVIPFNIVKGIIVSAITVLIYKRVSPILHR